MDQGTSETASSSSGHPGVVPSIATLRKVSTAVYLACEQSVAADLSRLLSWSADEIERLTGRSGCAARKQSLPEPADCNWPVCGCDPHAEAVIHVLEESGLLRQESSNDSPIT